MNKDLNGSFWLSHGEWSAAGKRWGWGGPSMRRVQRPGAGGCRGDGQGRLVQTPGDFGNRTDMDLVGGVTMGMRPQGLSDGWPGSKKGMKGKREFRWKWGAAAMGALLYVDKLDFRYL